VERCQVAIDSPVSQVATGEMWTADPSSQEAPLSPVSQGATGEVGTAGPEEAGFTELYE
jgi:hypothetical protein